MCRNLVAEVKKLLLQELFYIEATWP